MLKSSLANIFAKSASIQVTLKPRWHAFHAKCFVQYTVAANMVLCSQIDYFLGRLPSHQWSRRPGSSSRRQQSMGHVQWVVEAYCLVRPCCCSDATPPPHAGCTTMMMITIIFAARCLHKCGLCCRAVSVRLSVTFVYFVETSRHILELFSPPGSPLVFQYQTLWQYSDGEPTGASNAGGVWKKIAISDQYLAYWWSIRVLSTNFDCGICW